MYQFDNLTDDVNVKFTLCKSSIQYICIYICDFTTYYTSNTSNTYNTTKSITVVFFFSSLLSAGLLQLLTLTIVRILGWHLSIYIRVSFNNNFQLY